MDDNTSGNVERSAEFWRRVYAAVVIFTILVVTALWAFSRYFA
jgi:anti-sigma-K factor RskA